MLMRIRPTVSRDDAGQHGDRERDVAEHDDGRRSRRRSSGASVEAGVVPAHGLEQAPRAVEEVEARGRCWRRCRAGRQRAAQAGADVLVRRAPRHVVVAGAGPRSGRTGARRGTGRRSRRVQRIVRLA